MTRIESIMSQVQELTPAERRTVCELINQRVEAESSLDDVNGEFDGSLDPDQLAELHRRVAAFEAGTSIIEDEETVLRLLKESLEVPHQ